uniref:UvrABC system protein C n=1 Tax=Candidatus Kentrum sp. DK TaxID=2126562 RepID=A0A450TBU0_9GAMM|nr:MAG: Excinuclease ABC subunit C [Candidatus Kentron sp. DK]VFJ64299.1 MAG: Excinuclease ABC subunit C [Candidatus Kentron sp. DK]
MPDPGFDSAAFLANTPNRPGVYRMLGADAEILYVGKAGDLKKRLASYFRDSARLSDRLRSLVSRIRSVECTVTHTETEALLLENNLIKSLHPRYNILLRDDKSYPYLYISTRETFPALHFHRGARQRPGRYFGPFPSTGAVRETLQLLQKLFQVRQCQDSFFRNRSRPCLQYQIKRCKAPCVGRVTEAAYAEDVRHTLLFLEGKDREIIDSFVRAMDRAAQSLDYELAARYRDSIRALSRVQERQHIDKHAPEMGKGIRDIDIVVALCRNGVAVAQVFSIRAGRNLGDKTFFPIQAAGAGPAEVLAAFLPQYYLAAQRDGSMPDRILVNEDLNGDLGEDGGDSRAEGEDEHSDAGECDPLEAPPTPDPPGGAALLEAALSEHAGKKITISRPQRGEATHWLQMAIGNADLALSRRLVDKTTLGQRFEALRAALDLDETPARIECFDVSHTGGEEPVASCVVFGPDGPIKEAYRHFTLEGIEPGDDYAGLRQALRRRYTRVQKEGGYLPDLLLIDGGKGQLTQAIAILAELQLGGVTLVGVAKGPERKPGFESLFFPDRAEPLVLGADSTALRLIGQVRDEAHRFAVAGHRSRRGRKRNRSVLEGIPGVGARRRRQLLNEFGGLQGLKRASIEDIARVRGISPALAGAIYRAFHE